MEHSPLDMPGLHAFMRGLVDGGPTQSGHRTPPVVVTLPMDATSEAAVRANSWVIKQALAAGAHGLLLCHAEDPGAVRAFVESCRYPFAKSADGIGAGRRGAGGQAHAAEIWGVETTRYLELADPWPLNPEGELFLGIKVENARALERCEEIVAVPGIAFAEWGPGDMCMSFGYPMARPPYPDVLLRARARVKAACEANQVAFLEGASPENLVEKIAEGVKIFSGGDQGGDRLAELGRRHTGRTMPW